MNRKCNKTYKYVHLYSESRSEREMIHLNKLLILA